MNKFYINITLLAILSSPISILAQCTGGTLDAAIVPTTSWQTVTSHSKKYFTFAAIAGNVYIFSYCPCEGGSMSYAGEISIDSTASLLVNGDNTLTNYNDGFCAGTHDPPRVSWKCFRAGTYRVLTTHQFCATTSGTTATMAYKMETPSLCYTVTSIAYAPDAFNAGTLPAGVHSDDKISKSIYIGFPFCFNGITYDSLIISTNGYITFTGSCYIYAESKKFNGSVFSPYTTEAIPFGNTNYTPFIGPGVLFPWIDAYPVGSGGGNIYYNLYGTAPNRHFTVSYSAVNLFSCSSSDLTSEVQLYETSDVINIQANNIPDCTSWIGGEGVEGLLDETGFAAVVPTGRNHSAWTATNESWKFTPSCCTTTPLPIQLQYFECNSNDQDITLYWSTATETNNKYFTIERSGNGINFYSIATVPGAGNSIFPKYYEYKDTVPLKGDNYYRLSQTDFYDNTQQDYVIVCNPNTTEANDSLVIYPNPSLGIFSIQLPSRIASVLSTLTIYDLLGREVYKQSQENEQTINISTPFLASGFYIVHIDAAEKTYDAKLLIAR